jgi:hypothetical protein
MSTENYIKELETRVNRQRHRIISLEYDLDNLRSQTAVFAKNTLKIFKVLGFKEEHVIQMYKDIVNGLSDNLPS